MKTAFFLSTLFVGTQSFGMLASTLYNSLEVMARIDSTLISSKLNFSAKVLATLAASR